MHPPIPSNVRFIRRAERFELLGELHYKHAPTLANPERIRISRNWVSKHVVQVRVPQLAKLAKMRPSGHGFPRSGKVFWHKDYDQQLLALWEDWEDLGLLDYVITFAGTWAPRLVRGSRVTLSNHAYATAFDINAAWNAYSREPADTDEPGTVMPLVPSANSWGFWLGGHRWGPRTRADGMHFEIGAYTSG
jgi:hypothetical protein